MARTTYLTFVLIATGALLTVATARASDAEAASCDEVLGKQIFALCSACHALQADEPVREGPSLAGIFGKPAAMSDRAFKYSPALVNSQWTWDAATLDRFLLNPRRALRGTTMTFIGLKDANERAAVACYLQRQTATNGGTKSLAK